MERKKEEREVKRPKTVDQRIVDKKTKRGMKLEMNTARPQYCVCLSYVTSRVSA